MGAKESRWENALCDSCFGRGVPVGILYLYIAFILYKGTIQEWNGLLILGFLFYLLHTLSSAGVGGPVAATTQMV